MSVIGTAEGIDHGTIRGYRQHRYRKVEMCGPCRKAELAEQAKRRQPDPVIVGARFKSDAQEAWYGSPYSTEEMEAAHREHQRRRAATAGKSMPRMYRRPYPPYLPGHTDVDWGVPIAGRDLAVGDVLVHLGRHRTIDRFEPYEGSLSGVLGDGARTAYCGTWDIAVGPSATIRILPREGS